MSKYTEAIADILGLIKPTTVIFEEEKESLWTAVEALRIADRLEQADAISNEEIYIKACRRYGCWGSECPYRARDKFCSDLAEIFLDGYNQALADIRGDAE